MKLTVRNLILGLMLLGGVAQLRAQQSADTVNRGPILEQLSKGVLADEVIAIVGNTPILYSDVENTASRILEDRKAKGSLSELTPKEEALQMLLNQRLLSTCAVLDSLDKDMMPLDEEVEAQVAAMAKDAGGIRELEAKMGKPIYQIKADLLLDVRQSHLATLMQQNVVMGVNVEYAEVAQFVDTIPQESLDMIPAQYSYSQIIQSPPKTDERKYAVRERLLEFRRRILAGEVSLGVLARLYSMDLGSASNRGEMGPMPITQFVGPFAETVETLKPGEISEIVETEYGFHIIELISITDDEIPRAHLRHILLKPEFTVEESKNVSKLLDSIAVEVREGRLDFAKAAMEYSDDDMSKQNGGKAFNKALYDMTGDIRMASTRFMAEDLRADARYITTLKVGEVSQPYQSMNDKGDLVMKIVRLDEILPAHYANVVDDYDLLAKSAVQFKQAEALNKWIDSSIERVYVELSPEYWSYNLGSDEWVEAAKRSVEHRNLNVHFPSYEEIEQAVIERAARIAADREAAEAAGMEFVEGGETKKKDGQVVLDDIEVQKRKEAEEEASKRKMQQERGKGYGSEGRRYMY